ncbi:hypothetical protein [Persephonella sp. KM09-Lau-8]|uniref:hypothetical protein n=1 Tax=Persephonella sp. KM09-Lau-8 TaxID=1158345 RepID=UPI0004950C62|nr:hypothetical protein [Persephonella sp. KM09-Lau-8]
MNYELGYYEEKLEKETGILKEGFYVWKNTVNPEAQTEIERKYEGSHIILKGLALFPDKTGKYIISKEALLEKEWKILERKELKNMNLNVLYNEKIDGFISIPGIILEKIPYEKLKEEIENLLKQKEKIQKL